MKNYLIFIAVAAVLVVGVVIATQPNKDAGSTSNQVNNGSYGSHINPTYVSGGVIAEEVAAGLMAKPGATTQFCDNVNTLGVDQAEADFANGFGVQQPGAPSAQDVFAALLNYC